MDLILEAGTVVDEKFEVIELLGSGGMGQVFKARQIGLGRIVALKLLHADTLDSADSWARFDREAQTLAMLTHANIATFYAFGIWQEKLPYIAMEYLEGISLADLLIRDGKLNWSRTLKLCAQICEAMEHAHKAGVIHRDLKPANIIILEDEKSGDVVKVMDFGLAKLQTPNGKEVQKLTQTGMLIGSVRYLSPEQCRGFPADKRSDIYSLSCVLYECLTGEAPHSSENPIGLIHKHAYEQASPPSERLQEKLPTGLDDVVLKALSKDPDNRYQTMSALAQDLKQVSLGTGDRLPIFSEAQATRKTNSSAASSAWLLITGVILGLIVLVIAMWSMLNQHANQEKPAAHTYTHSYANKRADARQAEKLLAQGTDLLGKEQYQESKKVLEEALSLSNENSGLRTKIHILEVLGICHQHLNDEDGADKLYQQMGELAAKAGASRLPRDEQANWVLHSLNARVSSAVHTHDWKKVESLLALFKKKSEEFGALTPQSKTSYARLNGLYYENCADYRKAYAFYLQAYRDVQKTPGLYFASYLDILCAVIRLNAQLKMPLAGRKVFENDLLQCFVSFPTLPLSSWAVQIEALTEFLNSHGYRDEALKLTSDIKSISKKRGMWNFNTEASYQALLFRRYHSYGETPPLPEIEKAKNEFLQELKDYKNQSKKLSQSNTGISAIQAISRGLAHYKGFESAIIFLREVKTTAKNTNFLDPIAETKILSEIVGVASEGAKLPQFQSLPELAELNTLLANKDIPSSIRGESICSQARFIQSQGKVDEALNLYLQGIDALRDGKRVSSSDAEAYALIMLAEIHDKRGEFTEADKFYRQALRGIEKRHAIDSARIKYWANSMIKLVERHPKEHAEIIAIFKKKVQANDSK